MSILPVRLYASFAAAPGGGNIAGVLYDDVGLSNHEMQQIAADLNAPTTGFVRELEDRVFAVRFFSPSEEMDMCGHVTVAVFSALCEDGRLGPGRVAQGIPAKQRTAAGSLAISLFQEPGRQPVVRMRQNRPSFLTVKTSREEMADLLGIESGAVIGEIGAASTALRHLFVQLPHVDALSELRPDDAGLSALCRRTGINTIGVWALNGEDCESRVRVRDFCHGVGNGEEAASGTTNGALACWLAETGHLPAERDGILEVNAEQGVEMGRPSRIRTAIGLRDGVIDTVEVGGSARRLMVGDFVV